VHDTGAMYTKVTSSFGVKREKRIENNDKQPNFLGVRLLIVISC